MRGLFLILSLGWSVLMAYLLLSPGSGLPSFQLFEAQDKVAHLVLFAVWCFLLYQVKGSVQMILVIGVVIAGTTEWLQYYIPYRQADYVDFLLDLVGVVLGISAGFFVKKELFGAGKKFDK